MNTEQIILILSKMKTFLIITLSFILVSLDCKSQPTDNGDIIKLLSRIEKNNKAINSISYHIVYEQINPMNDSVLNKVVGKVWLKPDLRDTIFGSVFHVQGKDRGGLFDYFYDGTKSYEIRHENKSIIIFDPYKNENNPNNPARARSAIRLLINELTDTNLSETLSDNNPIKDLIVDKDCYLLSFKYPSNEYDQELTLTLTISKDALYLEKVQKHITWRGVEVKYSIAIDSLLTNDFNTLNEIFVQNTYPDYTTSEYERRNDKQSNSNFIGLKAKDFKYPTFHNDSINLESFIGKYVLLDFWESWCGYCILALPQIQNLQNKYKDNLVVIGISTENKPQIETLLQKNGITYINLFADQKILKDYSVSNRPTYFLIDRNGKIISHSLGDLSKIVTTLDDLL